MLLRENAQYHEGNQSLEWVLSTCVLTEGHGQLMGTIPPLLCHTRLKWCQSES